MASVGGLGGAATAGPASGRQLAATVVLTAALWGARLVGEVWRCKGTRRAGWGRSWAGFGCGGATRRLGRTGAKRTLWARPEHARDMLDKMLGHPRGSG